MLPPEGRAVVVGASLAGLRTAEALRREGHAGPLMVIGAERHWPPYDRPPLSKRVLAGTVDPERTRLRVADVLDDADVRTGVAAVGLDRAAQQVVLSDGTLVGYDGLVVATGARPRTLPGVEGVEGVVTLRTFDDAQGLRSLLDESERVAVVGAGWIGGEVASTCRDLGLAVTVIEALDLPLMGVLGPAMGQVVAGLHRGHGIDLRLGVGVADVMRDGGRARGVLLADGTEVPADVVVVGIGVTPETGWLDGSGLTVADGLVCDTRCRATTAEGAVDGRIVGVGDVARWHHPVAGRSMRVEHWTNAVEMSAVAAGALLHGDAAAPHAPVPYFWSDQLGTKLQFVGSAPPATDPLVVEGSIAEGRFVAVYGDGDRSVGALCVASPARVVPWQQRIAAGEPYPPDPSPGG